MNPMQMLAAAKPHLAHVPTRPAVQARVTLGFCDAQGTPQNNDRFFVVTPVTTRNTTNGARSDFAPGFIRWNGTARNPVGAQSFTLYLGASSVSGLARTRYRCQKGKHGDPTPPGNMPFCSSADGETARRWDGASMQDIPCLAGACPYLLSPDGGKANCAPLTEIVGSVAADDGTLTAVAIATQSAKSAWNLLTFLADTESQWAALHTTAGLEVPAFNWHGVPVVVSVQKQRGVFGESKRQYHRLHFALGISLPALAAHIAQHRQKLMAAGQTLPMLTAGDIEPAVTEAAVADLNPPPAEDVPPTPQDPLALILGGHATHTDMVAFCESHDTLPDVIEPVLLRFLTAARAAVTRSGGNDARAVRAVEVYEAAMQRLTFD